MVKSTMTETVPTSAVNMTLPAFAAERGSCCTAPLQLLRGAGTPGFRSKSREHRALSSRPAAHICCCRSMGQTDGRTPDLYLHSAPHTMRASSITGQCRQIVQPSQVYYSAPYRGAEYCDECVCLSVGVCVYLSVRDHIFGTTRPIFTNFLYVTPMAVARSSSGGVMYFRFYG